jgi:hypothetical protein
MNDKKPAPQPSNLQIELGEVEGQGIYSNLALITHSAAELVIDFARVLPGLKKAKVYSRILLTPYHAKALHRALGDNLAKYEKQHGPIKTPGNDESKSIGF